jgi:hypothetical protein
MSFSRHVGASALCLSAFLTPAAVSAQQAQLYNHQGCFYRTPNAAHGTMVGCNVAIAGRTMWADSASNAFYDPKTRLWFKVGDAANNIYALTQQGWVLIQLAPGGAQLLAELRPHGNQGTNIIVGPPAAHPLEQGMGGSTGRSGGWEQPSCQPLPGRPCPGRDAVYVHPHSSGTPHRPYTGRRQ